MKFELFSNFSAEKLAYQTTELTPPAKLRSIFGTKMF